jgi:hypothetical protein
VFNLVADVLVDRVAVTYIRCVNLNLHGFSRRVKALILAGV